MPPTGVQVILKPFKSQVQNFTQKSNWNFDFWGVFGVNLAKILKKELIFILFESEYK